jgi:transposase
MTQPLFFDANSQTGKPNGQALVFVNFDFGSVCTTSKPLYCLSTTIKLTYFIMVNRKISPDLKSAALRLWDLGWDEIDIIQGLAVSRSSMYRWKALFEDIGDVVRPPSPLRGRTRIICRAVLTAIQDIYRGEPDLYLDELVFWLAVHHDIVISKSALHLNLKEAGLSRKLLHKIAIERDAQLREEYMDIINGELEGDSSMLVFADETSKNDHTLARRYGLALAGERAAFTDLFVRGQRWSLAAAISLNGYIATKVVPGSLDSFDIFDFVAEQVVCSGPR